VEADAQTVINALAVRWDVEVFFEDYKDLLDSDQYQLMSATVIIRFWTLLSCLTCFLDERRAYLQAQNPGEHFTLGDARQALQAEHQRNLLTWLEVQFQSGMTASQLGARLTVRPTIKSANIVTRRRLWWSFCKKIRNDKGYYEAVEAYVTRHSDAGFSHTLCPDCLAGHYPDLYDKVL
jgi:hypothetical protein